MTIPFSVSVPLLICAALCILLTIPFVIREAILWRRKRVRAHRIDLAAKAFEDVLVADDGPIATMDNLADRFVVEHASVHKHGDRRYRDSRFPETLPAVTTPIPTQPQPDYTAIPPLVG